MAEGSVAGIFVGIDSGGTRTNVRIERRATGEIGPVAEHSYEVAEALSGALAPELVATALRRIVGPLEAWLSRTDQSGRSVYMWISAAGFTGWTREEYLLALRGLDGLIVDANLRVVGAANDAVTLVLGSRSDGIVIAGTGSSVIVRDHEGALHQSGGHEWVACDYGSGFWIGLRAIRRAYRDLENGDESVLLQRMRDVYSIGGSDQQGLIERVRELAVGDKHMKKDIAKFAASVCDAAERGDVAAQDIVKLEAEDLADVMASAIRRHVTREGQEAGLDLVQCGSLLNNGFYRGAFESQLQIRLLSSDNRPTQLRWERLVTGDRPAVAMAIGLAEDPERYLALGPAFRPAIYVP